MIHVPKSVLGSEPAAVNWTNIQASVRGRPGEGRGQSGGCQWGEKEDICNIFNDKLLKIPVSLEQTINMKMHK